MLADLDALYQRSGRGRNGDKDFTTAQTTFTMITAKDATDWTIYVQRLIVWIKTDAAQSITFQDSASTPIVVAKIPASPGADTRWEFYFGPRGKPLTKGKNLTATFSAAGLAGHMEWVGYEAK